MHIHIRTHTHTHTHIWRDWDEIDLLSTVWSISQLKQSVALSEAVVVVVDGRRVGRYLCGLPGYKVTMDTMGVLS